MKKQLLLTLLIVAMSLSSFSVTAHDFEVDGIYYNILSSTELTVEVTSSSNNIYSGDIVIPESVTYSGSTYSVIKIGDSAFEFCSNLTSVSMPNSIKVIGNSAFSFSELTSITIPESVTTIGNYAFSGSKLSSIVIPDSVTEIGYDVFDYSKNLTSVHIGSSITYLEQGLFSYCDSLSYITVSEDNQTFDSRDNCNAIIITASNTLSIGCKNSIIPNTITTIGSYAFGSCKNLETITIPNSVTTIKGGSFEYSGLKSITIPNSVLSVGEYTFSGCTQLTSVTIGSSVSYIGTTIFDSCGNLTSIVVSEDNTTYDSRDNCNAVIETATNTLTQGCKTSVIPNTVTCIGYAAFGDCYNLESISIPNSVTTISSNAFVGCRNMTSITIPNSVISIGDGAFCGCKSLTSIIIPNSVISIGQAAFQSCTGLKSIILGSSLESLDADIFNTADNLEYIYSYNTVPPTCSYATFRDFDTTTCQLIVPTGSATAYATAIGWKDFFNISESGIEGVENDCDNATEIVRYNIHGRQLSQPTSGINIIKMSDGTTRKEFVK